MREKPKVGVAFQSCGLLGQCIYAGAIRALVDKGAFDNYNIHAFSGSTGGALTATLCWGHTLQNNIKELPDALERLWMSLATGLIPNAAAARILNPLQSLAYFNPGYRWWSDNFASPSLRVVAEYWLQKNIPIQEFIDSLRASRSDRQGAPSLLLGAIDVIKGKQTVFTEDDLCLDTLFATGFLLRGAGVFNIDVGGRQGTYCSGISGHNPPVAELVERDIDQIWIIETIPRERTQAPLALDECMYRQDELSQALLLERELSAIENMNAWIARGIIDPKKTSYKTIEIKRMPMQLTFPFGSNFVVSPWFVQEMIEYGCAIGEQLIGGSVKKEIYQTAGRRFLYDSIRTQCHAIARIKDHETAASLIVGQDYTIEAGIEFDGPDIERDVSISPAYVQEGVEYDVMVSAAGMQTLSSRIQSFQLRPEDRSYFAHFVVRPGKAGASRIAVSFFQQRNCVAQIDFDVNVQDID